MSTIKNYTPHDIVLCGNVIKSSGVARVSVTSVEIGNINGIPVSKNTYGEVVGLPEVVPGTVYIVSSLVAQAVKGIREDCLIVDKTIRNDAGQVVGCEGLAEI